MKIVELVHRLPWPPVDGGKKGTLGFVEGYRRNAEVERHRLLCMCPQEESDWVARWDAPDVQVDLMDARNTVGRLILNTLGSRIPFNMAKYQRPEFARMVADALRAEPPDVVHVDSLHCAWYADVVRREAPQALLVLRCHNAEHVIMERLAKSQTNPVKRMLIGIQARRLHAYEAAALDQFDLVLAITEADAARFRAMNPLVDSRMIVVPAGADLPDRLPTAPDTILPIRLIHIAAMDWLPNQAGLRWLLSEVLPLLDASGLDYHLDIVGKNMPAEFHAFGSERVTVHGFVEELAPITSAAHIALVPLQVGGGMRVKILDYWAMGIPVVSTSVGAEGLADGDERVIAVADDASAFAGSILELAHSAQSREVLRVAGFRKVSAHYGWPALVDGLVARYRRLRPGVRGTA